MKTKKKMTVLAIVIVIAAILLVPNWQTDAAAGHGWKHRCKLQGTWYGRYIDQAGSFMVTYHGAGPNKGTSDIDWIESDPTMGGYFPEAVSQTNSRGVWKRTGPNTFDYTTLTFGLDADDEIVWILRSSGTKTLPDCNTMEATISYDIMTPDLDPIDDDGLCIPSDDVLIVRRITLKEPCEE
jgi:hypothetical protein